MASGGGREIISLGVTKGYLVLRLSGFILDKENTRSGRRYVARKVRSKYWGSKHILG